MSIPGVNSRLQDQDLNQKRNLILKRLQRGGHDAGTVVSLQADLADTDAHLESLRGRRADIKRRNRTSLLDGQSPRPAVDVGELEGSLPVLQELTERPSEQKRKGKGGMDTQNDKLLTRRLGSSDAGSP